MNYTLQTEYPLWVWLALIAASAAWAINYGLLIRRSALDRTWGMPIAALALNIAHEFHHAFIVPHGGGRWIVDAIWFGLDCVILYQVLRFCRVLFHREASARAVWLTMAAAIVGAWALIAAMGAEFDDPWGLYFAWFAALIMGILYSGMLIARGSLDGQSLYIALTRWIGNALFAVIWLPYLPDTILIPILVAGTTIVDSIYVALVWRACGRVGISPWRRI